MARPLSASDPRGGYNGNYEPRYHLDGASGNSGEIEQLRAENAQLHNLRAELEQALIEATQEIPDVSAYEERIREYEVLLEEKSETIRQLHQQLEVARAALEEQNDRPPAGRTSGPAPREDDLLTLSEELERERRQLQEDEASLMEQMRQMEIAMARERAEMARQRNDLQRLHGEIRHELERLERNGALQTKMEDLKAKLQDAVNRRGAAPVPTGAKPQTATNLPQVNSQNGPPSTPGRGGLVGRLFGGK